MSVWEFDIDLDALRSKQRANARFAQRWLYHMGPRDAPLLPLSNVQYYERIHGGGTEKITALYARSLERWVENPYYQFFCGEEFFQHRLVFDRPSLTRWRQRMGEEKLQALLQESLAVVTKTEAIKPSISTASSSTPRCRPRT